MYKTITHLCTTTFIPRTVTLMRQCRMFAGEEAQLIIEEVANLLRNSAGSGGAGATSAEHLLRTGSARSSLGSAPERSASAEQLPSAGSAEQPLLWGRLTHSPSAPMPLRGGEPTAASSCKLVAHTV